MLTENRKERNKLQLPMKKIERRSAKLYQRLQ